MITILQLSQAIIFIDDLNWNSYMKSESIEYKINRW